MPAQGELCKYEGNSVLLVEGLDDCHVAMSLCQAHSVPETFGIYECGSDDKVLKRLNALISQPDAPKIIGVVLDADYEPGRRWESIKSKLSHYPYSFPEKLDTNGTILITNSSLPKLGIWLMPNNQVSGMLEDFCLEMIDHEVYEFVKESVIHAQNQKGICTFKPTHLSKAIVHTYLAWQDEPGFPLGHAITRQSLRPHSPTAITFVTWLIALFGRLPA